MPREYDSLSVTERVYISGFCRNDPKKVFAVVLRVFGERPLEEVAAETGLAKTTIHRLCERFVPLYDDWVAAFTNPETADETVVEELNESVRIYMEERLGAAVDHPLTCAGTN